MANNAEEIYKRLNENKSVLGVMVLSDNGSIVQTSMDNSTTTEISSALTPLAHMAQRVIKDMDLKNELVFLRMRSKKNETMIGFDKGDFVVVIQDPALR